MSNETKAPAREFWIADAELDRKYQWEMINKDGYCIGYIHGKDEYDAIVNATKNGVTDLHCVRKRSGEA